MTAMRARVATLALLTTPIVTPRAATASPMTASATSSPWLATTHLAFAIADQSSTGFAKVGGSAAVLDLTREIPMDLFGAGARHGTVGLGVRSSGQGGQGLRDREFYRFGAGPLLTWMSPDLSWLLSMSLARFTETGLADGTTQYRSRGAEGTLGWQRLWRLAPRVSVGWGGFIGMHQGDITAATPSLTPALGPSLNSPAIAGPGTWQPPAANRGLTHGLDLSLQMAL